MLSSHEAILCDGSAAAQRQDKITCLEDLRQPPHVCLKLFRDEGRTMAGGDRHLERWEQRVSGEMQCTVSG